MEPAIVPRYLELGLALGRHVEGLVDAYYGPDDLASRAKASPPRHPGALVAEARALVADTDGGAALDPPGGPGTDGSPADSAADAVRRRWIRAQLVGLLTSARVLGGERLAYADEVELAYGVRPRRTSEEELQEAHRRLDEVMPGSGPLAQRFVDWRETQTVPADKLRPAIGSLVEDLRARTSVMFGLPDGERVEFELVTDQPWAGFNYYLGGLHSRVAVNVDLPVPSTSLAHLVAHEAYPGHHTEHVRKEVGLVRRRRWMEESIFLVGTPQCLLAEGLADLGIDVVLGRRHEGIVAEHLRPLGIPYEPEVVAAVAEAGEALTGVRANAAFRLHEDGVDPEVVVEEVAMWGLLPRPRAEKAVSFLLDPTWRTYITCYVEGLQLCRRFVDGRAERFAQLITEQLVPSDLAA